MRGLPRTHRRFARLALVAAILGAMLPLALLSGTASAATKTWTGLGNSFTWSDPGNWNGNVAPVAGDALVFPAGVPGPASKNLTNDFPNGTTFASLTIQDNGYNLGGN